MTLAFATLALCAIALAAWWFVRTMRRADAQFRCDVCRALSGLLGDARDINLRLDRLCELLGYDTEDTGLKDPSTTEDAT